MPDLPSMTDLPPFEGGLATESMAPPGFEAPAAMEPPGYGSDAFLWDQP